MKACDGIPIAKRTTPLRWLEPCKDTCVDEHGYSGDVMTLSKTEGMDDSALMLAALRFNEKINQRDLEGLAQLMTDDHTFIDNAGEITRGKEVMKEGWREFLEKYPDYRNVFTSVTVRDGVVVMVGYSTCSYEPLDGPNIWTAKVRDGRVSEWRVYWLDESEDGRGGDLVRVGQAKT